MEREEYGGLGVVANTNRPYFDPFDGLVVAHDIIEHTVKPFPSATIDEFLAIGGMIAGRLENGWFNPRSGRRFNYENVVAEVSRIATDCINNGDSFCEIACRVHLKNKKIEEQIGEAVRAGIKEAEYETEESLDCNAESVIAWICRGHQAYRKRFERLDNCSIANHLFDSITTCCNQLIEREVEGHVDFLHVDFSGYNCFLRSEL